VLETSKLTFLSSKLTFLSSKLTFLSIKLTFLSSKLTFFSVLPGGGWRACPHRSSLRSVSEPASTAVSRLCTTLSSSSAGYSGAGRGRQTPMLSGVAYGRPVRRQAGRHTMQTIILARARRGRRGRKDGGTATSQMYSISIQTQYMYCTFGQGHAEPVPVIFSTCISSTAPPAIRFLLSRFVNRLSSAACCDHHHTPPCKIHTVIVWCILQGGAAAPSHAKQTNGA
jgi:hypothetical protein